MSAPKPHLILAGSEQDDAPLLLVEAFAAVEGTKSVRDLVLRKTSPVAAEALRLGLIATGGSATTFAVHLPAGFVTGDLAASSTAGMYRGLCARWQGHRRARGPRSGQQRLRSGWTTGGVGCGGVRSRTAFQVEISCKLDALRDAVEVLKQADVHARVAQLAASAGAGRGRSPAQAHRTPASVEASSSAGTAGESLSRRAR